MTSPPPSGSSARTRWLRAVLLVASTLLALLALEGTVRLRQWLKYGSPTGAAFALAPDPETGLPIPEPGQRTRRIQINQRGFRSPEIPAEKPTGTVRLAFLGGSTTFCAEVSGNEATWPHLVWKALSERHPGVPFDYVNAGVPGYGQEAMRTTLEDRVAPLRPDVIVMYELTNDLSGDTRKLARAQGLFEGKAEDPSALARLSVAWYLVEKNLIVRRRQRGASSGRTLVYDADSLAAGYRGRVTACVRAAMAVAPVCAVGTFSHRPRRGQPPEVALANSNTALYYSPYLSVAGLLDGFDAYNRAVRAAAESTGAILIAEEDRIPADGIHFADSVHFTDAGARAMADRVIRALEAAPEFQRLIAGRGHGGRAGRR